MNQLPTTALVRRVAQTYAGFHLEAGITISPELAETEHAAYISALQAAGLQVQIAAADDTFPDCVFIEDVAVVFGSRALIGRLSPHREGEQEPIEKRLRQWHETLSLAPGALLEGGDVLHIGSTTYVGLTGRTNEAGAESLRDFLRPLGQRVVAVPSQKSLHLKSVVTYLGDGVLIAAPDFVDLRRFEINDIIFTPRDEITAANCLRVGNDLLIPAGKPATEKRLREFAERKGINLVPLNISEFEKGEGSLTCLSLIW